VLTVSDAAARGARDDESGQRAAERLAGLPAEIVWRGVVADEAAAIEARVLETSASADLLVITGGTGLGPRDRTPQTVAPLLDYQVPGLAEAMRAQGLATTPHAMLSRQIAGVRGGCLVLVLPGSPRAVAECLDAVWPALPHALRLLAGQRDPHQAPPGTPSGSPG
jgi:molybdenum cofactor synthesis domain-containing protein